MTQKEMYDFCQDYISKLLKKVKSGKILMFKHPEKLYSYKKLSKKSFVFNKDDLTIKIVTSFLTKFTLCDKDVSEIVFLEKNISEYKEELDKLFFLFTEEKI